MSKYFVVSGDNRFYAKEPNSELYTGCSYISDIHANVNLIADTQYLKEHMIKNSQYIDEKYYLYVELLSKALNFVHNSKYEMSFWQKSLSLNIKRYITLLHIAQKEFSYFDPGKYKIEVLLDESSFFTPEDFEEQRTFLQHTDLGREQLFSIYISLYYPDLFKRTKKISVDYFTTNKVSFASKCKIMIKKVKKLICNEYSRTQVAILDSYFSKENERKLVHEKSISRIFVEQKQYEPKNIDALIRRKIYKFISININDKFDLYFINSLIYLLPAFFVEHFDTNRVYYLAELNKYPNIKYILCEAWISNTKDSFFLALAKEYKNVSHIYTEHNTLFHPFIGNSTNFILDMVDLYYTLGWDSPKSEKIKAGASLFFQEEIQNRVVDRNQILFVDVAAFAYLEEYNTKYSESDVFARVYLNFLKEFFSKVKLGVGEHIVYRPYPTNLYNWKVYDNVGELEHTLPSNVIFDDFKFSGKEMMLKSRLNIISYTNTAYLESIISNIPTIFFWNKDVGLLNNNNLSFFDGLISTGICQTSAQEAAHFVSELIKSDSIEEWWFSEVTQAARRTFMDENIGNPKDAIDFYCSLVE